MFIHGRYFYAKRFFNILEIVIFNHQLQLLDTDKNWEANVVVLEFKYRFLSYLTYLISSLE